MKNIKIYNEDCFTILKDTPDNSVELFLLDLPYANIKFGSCTDCKWDLPIDLEDMWKEIRRIGKKGCIYIFFCNAKFGYALIDSNKKNFRYDLIWKKSRKVGFLNSGNQPLRQHENIYLFKESKSVYNPQVESGKPYDRGDHERRKVCVYGNKKVLHKPNKGTRQPTSVVDHESMYIFKEAPGVYNPQKIPGKPYKSHRGEDKCKLYARGIGANTVINTGDRHPSSCVEPTYLEYNNPQPNKHPTQKPVELLEWLIKTYSNEGMTVMDFCMGSGSCGVACINTNRKFIGVEKNSKYFSDAKLWLEKVYKEKNNNIIEEEDMEYDSENELDEIEDLVRWNLSFNIPVDETLEDIDRLDLLDMFIELEEDILDDESVNII